MPKRLVLNELFVTLLQRQDQGAGSRDDVLENPFIVSVGSEKLASVLTLGVSFHNPPFMPWFMRRNEIWLHLAQIP